MVATDDSVRFSSFADVFVTVKDINDNSPVFLNESYRYFVLYTIESLTGTLLCYRFVVGVNPPIGTIVGRVQATDADSGNFGQINYRLSVSSNR